jgi:hypothetical protein
MLMLFLAEACPSVTVPKSNELGLKETAPIGAGVGGGVGVEQKASGWHVGFHCPNVFVPCLGLHEHFNPGPHPKTSDGVLVVEVHEKLSSHIMPWFKEPVPQLPPVVGTQVALE